MDVSFEKIRQSLSSSCERSMANLLNFSMWEEEARAKRTHLHSPFFKEGGKSILQFAPPSQKLMGGILKAGGGRDIGFLHLAKGC